jgi:hypothetical protein
MTADLCAVRSGQRFIEHQHEHWLAPKKKERHTIHDALPPRGYAASLVKATNDVGWRARQ